MWEWGNLFFLSTQVFFTSIYLPFIHIYLHLSHPKTIKVKLPCQIKSSGNQPNPIVLKNWKTKELSTKCKIFSKLLSFVVAKIKSNNEKQFPTHYPVHTKWRLQTIQTIQIILLDATTLSTFINQSSSKIFSRNKLLFSSHQIFSFLNPLSPKTALLKQLKRAARKLVFSKNVIFKVSYQY